MENENPSGTKLLYVRWPDGLEGGRSWIVLCKTDGTRQRVVVEDDFLDSAHTGAMTHWISDENRIYVNWPVSETETGVFSYDISALVKANREAEDRGEPPIAPDRVKVVACDITRTSRN